MGARLNQGAMMNLSSSEKNNQDKEALRRRSAWGPEGEQRRTNSSPRARPCARGLFSWVSLPCPARYSADPAIPIVGWRLTIEPRLKRCSH